MHAATPSPSRPLRPMWTLVTNGIRTSIRLRPPVVARAETARCATQVHAPAERSGRNVREVGVAVQLVRARPSFEAADSDCSAVPLAADIVCHAPLKPSVIITCEVVTTTTRSLALAMHVFESGQARRAGACRLSRLSRRARPASTPTSTATTASAPLRHRGVEGRLDLAGQCAHRREAAHGPGGGAPPSIHAAASAEARIWPLGLGGDEERGAAARSRCCTRRATSSPACVRRKGYGSPRSGRAVELAVGHQHHRRPAAREVEEAAALLPDLRRAEARAAVVRRGQDRAALLLLDVVEDAAVVAVLRRDRENCAGLHSWPGSAPPATRRRQPAPARLLPQQSPASRLRYRQWREFVNVSPVGRDREALGLVVRLVGDDEERRRQHRRPATTEKRSRV